MKIFKLIFLNLLLCGFTYAQSYVSSTEINIIQSLTKITYVNGNIYVGSPNYHNSSNILGTLQARYDAAYDLINSAWGKVKYTELINTQNKSTLSSWNTQVQNFLRNDWPRSYNWGKNPSKATEVATWVLSVFNRAYIKSEIILLKEVDSEIKRLKRAHPGAWHKTERYKEISTAINLLRTSHPNQIQNISAKYGLF
tara:strand:+ start:125 stop:715 length:591 start_codon:yes stop_codon:yes gene_type:complete